MTVLYTWADKINIIVLALEVLLYSQICTMVPPIGARTLLDIDTTIDKFSCKWQSVDANSYKIFYQEILITLPNSQKGKWKSSVFLRLNCYPWKLHFITFPNKHYNWRSDQWTINKYPGTHVKNQHRHTYM